MSVGQPPPPVQVRSQRTRWPFRWLKGPCRFFAGQCDKLQTLVLIRVVQPGTDLVGHDWQPGELVGWVLNISCWGVQVLLRHVNKSDGNRGTLGYLRWRPRYVHDLDKWQTMPAEYSFKKVHGAGDHIPRRFVIEVDIAAATSLLKHAASLGLQHLVKGESINIF